MAKNSIRDFDGTAANNTDIQSTDISEGCPASGINNAIRELMADIKDVSAGTVALESPQADSLTVTGDLTVDTDTLFVDASADKVAFGTTDVAAAQVTIKGSGNPRQLVITDDGAEKFTFFQIGNLATIEAGSGGSATTALAIKTSSSGTESEVARFLGGGGLTFNGDTAAANALDDYEEGTFEPTFTSAAGDFTNIGYSGDTGGRYIKVGNLVYAQGCARINGTLDKSNRSSGDTLVLGNLPFTQSSRSNGDNADSIANVRCPVWGSGDVPDRGIMRSGDDAFSLVQHRSNATSNTITVGDLPSDAMMQFTVMYTTN